MSTSSITSSVSSSTPKVEHKTKNIKIALVIGEGDTENDFEMVDVLKLECLSISPPIYLINTSHLKNRRLLAGGCGDKFTPLELQTTRDVIDELIQDYQYIMR